MHEMTPLRRPFHNRAIGDTIENLIRLGGPDTACSMLDEPDEWTNIHADACLAASEAVEEGRMNEYQAEERSIAWVLLHALVGFHPAWVRQVLEDMESEPAS
jgi:hypothetical protein